MNSDMVILEYASVVREENKIDIIITAVIIQWKLLTYSLARQCVKDLKTLAVSNHREPHTTWTLCLLIQKEEKRKHSREIFPLTCSNMQELWVIIKKTRLLVSKGCVRVCVYEGVDER